MSKKDKINVDPLTSFNEYCKLVQNWKDHINSDPQNAIQHLFDAYDEAFKSYSPNQEMYSRFVTRNSELTFEDSSQDLVSPYEAMNELVQAVDYGVLPSIPALLVIAQSFSKYMAMEGAISLDKAFEMTARGHKKKFVEVKERQIRESFLVAMAAFKIKYPDKSVEQAAFIINRLTKPSDGEESFVAARVTEYYRNGNGKEYEELLKKNTIGRHVYEKFINEIEEGMKHLNQYEINGGI